MMVNWCSGGENTTEGVPGAHGGASSILVRNITASSQQLQVNFQLGNITGMG